MRNLNTTQGQDFENPELLEMKRDEPQDPDSVYNSIATIDMENQIYF